jgi:hypothetical protein
MRAPHFLILDHFLFATLSSDSLSVLRVLTRQTLEISMEVKDPSFSDPCLAKVVKDSTLTILFRSDHFLLSFLKEGAILEGFLQERRTVQP